jgi:hypothetical protein
VLNTATVIQQMRQLAGEEAFWPAFKRYAERWRFDHDVSWVITLGRLEIVVAFLSLSLVGAATAHGAPLHAMNMTLTIRNATRAPRIHPPRSIRVQQAGSSSSGGARSIGWTPAAGLVD